MRLNNEILAEAVASELKKSDVVDLIKKDKDVEKRVRAIVADTLTDFFKVMYQHSGVFKNLTK